MESDPFVIQDPRRYAGHWRDFFGNDYPLHIEIGMGKGQFLHRLAELHPDINYLGIEKFSSVLVRALEKRTALDQDNLYFLRMDAEDITEIFASGEVQRIYLNFSDPWPKDRHAKRRLTSTRFLARYNKILAPEGILQFKTDNTDLFRFSLEQLEEAGWTTDEVNFHLHENGPAPDNVMTEYEEKFWKLGNPIHKLVAHR